MGSAFLEGVEGSHAVVDSESEEGQEIECRMAVSTDNGVLLGTPAKGSESERVSNEWHWFVRTGSWRYFFDFKPMAEASEVFERDHHESGINESERLRNNVSCEF